MPNKNYGHLITSLTVVIFLQTFMLPELGFGMPTTPSGVGGPPRPKPLAREGKGGLLPPQPRESYYSNIPTRSSCEQSVSKEQYPQGLSISGSQAQVYMATPPTAPSGAKRWIGKLLGSRSRVAAITDDSQVSTILSHGLVAGDTLQEDAEDFEAWVRLNFQTLVELFSLNAVQTPDDVYHELTAGPFLSQRLKPLTARSFRVFRNKEFQITFFGIQLELNDPEALPSEVLINDLIPEKSLTFVNGIGPIVLFNDPSKNVIEGGPFFINPIVSGTELQLMFPDGSPNSTNVALNDLSVRHQWHRRALLQHESPYRDLPVLFRDEVTLSLFPKDTEKFTRYREHPVEGWTPTEGSTFFNLESESGATLTMQVQSKTIPITYNLGHPKYLYGNIAVIESIQNVKSIRISQALASTRMRQGEIFNSPDNREKLAFWLALQDHYLRLSLEFPGISQLQPEDVREAVNVHPARIWVFTVARENVAPIRLLLFLQDGNSIVVPLNDRLSSTPFLTNYLIKDGKTALRFDTGSSFLIKWVQVEGSGTLRATVLEDRTGQTGRLSAQITEWLTRSSNFPITDILRELSQPILLSPQDDSETVLEMTRSAAAKTFLLTQSVNRAIPRMAEVIRLAPMREIADFSQDGLTVGHRGTPIERIEFGDRLVTLLQNLEDREGQLQKLLTDITNSSPVLQERLDEIRSLDGRDFPSEVRSELSNLELQIQTQRGVLAAQAQSIRRYFLTILRMWTGSLRSISSIHSLGYIPAGQESHFAQAVEALRDRSLVNSPTISEAAVQQIEGRR